MLGFVFKSLGANVEGRFLYFGSTLYEIPYLSVADRTVSDGARLFGHYAVFSNITLGPVRVSGILHENTLAMANSTVSVRQESGPWRYIESDEVDHGTLDTTEAAEKSASLFHATDMADLEAQI